MQNIESKLDLDSIAKQGAINIALALEESAKEHLRDCRNILEALRSEKYEYFRDLIRKTQIYASQNMLTISNAIYIAQSEDILTTKKVIHNVLVAK